MSKNFELLQKIEKDLAFVTKASAEPDSQPSTALPSDYVRPQWATEEASRLVQQIFLARADGGPRAVVFTSLNDGAACGEICASVAENLAQSSNRAVCLVDSNFRAPSLSKLFGAANDPGLANALLEKGRIISFTQTVGPQNLWLLPSGAVAAPTHSLLSTQNLRTRFAELREEFDFVIINAPAFTRCSDPVVLGQQSDGVVLVLEAESARHDAASVALASLGSAHVPVLAAVLKKRSLSPFPQQRTSVSNAHERRNSDTINTYPV